MADQMLAAGDLGRREVYAEIKKLCAPNNYTNLFVLAREYAVYALLVGACLGFVHWIQAQGWSIGWAVPVYALTVAAIGIWFQNRLACLVHESSHYSLFRHRVLNDVMANLFVCFPFFGTVSNYRIGHWAHHRHVNDPERDPDLHRLVKHHPRNFPVPKGRFFWEYVLIQLLPHKAFTYLKGRALYVAVTMKHKRVRNQDALGSPVVWVLRIVYYGTLFALLTVCGWWHYYFLFWLVPLITVYPATLFLREIGHHGNYPDNGDYTNSRIYEGYWLEREIFFPFSERNHVLHHMFPTVPWHKMKQAHDVLMRFPDYRDSVVICDGFFFKREPVSGRPSVLDIVSQPADRYLARKQVAALPGEVRQLTADEVGSAEMSVFDRQTGES